MQPPPQVIVQKEAKRGCLWWVGLGVAALVVIGVIGALASSDDETAPDFLDTTVPTDEPADESVDDAQDEPETTDAPRTPEVVTLTGQGQEATDPFELAGGSYLVAYDFQQDCFYGAVLKDPSGQDFVYENVGTGSGPVKGETNLYDIDPGTYFVDVITGPPPGCPWSVTLTRR